MNWLLQGFLVMGDIRVDLEQVAQLQENNKV
jgi:hypothetical protein